MNERPLDNCEKTIHKLTQFIERAGATPDELSQAGVIQAFEFTFEVFWKTFQKIGQAEGVMIGSPKSAFSFAYQTGLIEHEDVWLALLSDRNMTTHTYHEGVATEIFDRIKKMYLKEFQQVYKKLLEHSYSGTS